MNKITVYFIFLCYITGAYAQDFVFSEMKDIYHDLWIDFNKNGKKDIYEDRTRLIEERIEDLLAQMTIEEKTCQLATLYGYKRVLEDDLPTEEWKNKIWKDGIGAIDEHLNSFSGWGKKPMENPNCWPASTHLKAMNTVQRFFIEQTRLGIPADFTNEGIRGVEAYQATNFPTQLGIGHTWNKELVREIGRITGKEARALGYTNIYSPILDVGRDQRWGRMEEVYGESPYLVSRLGVEMVKGLQENYQVASTAKHFAVYSIPKGGREGMCRTDPKAGWREVHQLFLAPFRAAVEEAGILGVMSSYNDYDGVPVTGSSYFLIDLLRNLWGFKGYVVSDSDALEYLFTKHRVADSQKEAVRQAVAAGLNVRCTFTPPEDFILPLRELIHENRISMDVIDDRVRDVLRVKFLVGLFDSPYGENPEEADKIVNCTSHNETALQASRESIVLLKNRNSILPFKKEIKKITVCGPNAAAEDYAVTHYGPQGVEVVSVLEGIEAEARERNILVQYTKGCELVDENWPDSEILPEPLSEKERKEIQKAVELTEQSDLVIVVAGGGLKTCGESKSRSSLQLPGRQLDLIKSVHKTGKPVVVVLINGRPLAINWTNQYVDGIIEAWYPGSHGGTAVAEVLFGEYNPGGKLTVTFPKCAGQILMNFPAKPFSQSDNTWSKARVNGVIYPFGFGLSYTEFEYKDLKINPLKQFPSGDIHVEVTVKNVGKVKGDEVVQLYLRDKFSSVTTYDKNLRGFERVSLNPGQEKIVKFVLKPKDLELLDRNMNWVVEPGDFEVMVGSSSEDIHLRDQFTIIPL